MAPLRIANIWIYPIKSLGGIALDAAEIDQHGIRHDRRMMLVDRHGRFITQREHPKLSQFRVALSDDGFEVTGPAQNAISITHSEIYTGTMPVTVWASEVQAGFVSEAADGWFSQALDQHVRLVRMIDSSWRPVDPKYSRQGDTTAFTDGYPLLFIGNEALNTLNAKLASPIPMTNFRPSVSFSGGEPNEEDFWKAFTIANHRFWGVKQCSRCVMTTIDQATGQKGKEPLLTLAEYRRFGNAVMFGQNVLTEGRGRIAVGDEITVTERHPDLSYMVPA